MNKNEPSTPSGTQDRAGPARDFAAFSELELERRRNSDQEFDTQLFQEAVALVTGKIAGFGGAGQGGDDDDHQ